MRILGLFLFIGLTVTSYSQEPATVKKLNDRKKDRQEAAKENILALKSGVLLVRLDFDKNEVKYYEKYQNLKAANKLKKKALERNLQIIDAFKTYYNFSPFYFFDISDSRSLLDDGPSAITFYNDQGEEDKSIKVDASKYFIAEFGYIEPDTISYYSGSTPSTNSERDPQGKSYYGDGKTSKPALVIRDPRLVQLREPFPYFRGYAQHGGVTKRYRVPVKLWTEKLNEFYGKHSAVVNEGEE